MNTVHSLVNIFARVELHIGSLMCDAEWRDNQWSSIKPETYKAMAIAAADGDSVEAGNILEQAISKLARIEADRVYGVKS